MDRNIESNLEHYLQGTLDARQLAEFEQALASASPQVRETVQQFQRHAHLIRETLKAPAEAAPAPGFYARVVQRIEAQRVASVWSVFVEPQYFRRLALASLALLVLLGVTVWTAPPERELAFFDDSPEFIMAGEPEPLPVTSVADPDEGRNHVLVDLTTFQE